MKKSRALPNKKVIFQAVYQELAAQPLMNFLKKASPLSGRSLRKYFFKSLILLNNHPAHSQADLEPGDTVTIFEAASEYQVLIPEAMPLDIIYENPNMLIINKPAGLVVHPVKEITSGTLANGVAAYFSRIGLPVKIRPVNRLDAGTSGLIIFAKNSQAQDALSSAIKLQQIKRIYYAVVWGIPECDHGIIDRPIMEQRGKRIISEQGQPAETHFWIIERFREAALLELLLKTGRTHQIRIHLNSINHPLLGDPQYGIKNPLINRPALHAGKLDFSGSQFTIPELTARFPNRPSKTIDWATKIGF